MENQIMTRGELARHYKVHPDTIRNWTRAGLIPVFCEINGRPRYKLAEVDAALSGKKETPASA